MRPLLRSIAHVDRSQISFVTALRNAIGTVAPLAVGAATGHLLVGLTVSIGALNGAFSDRPGPYHQRAGRMLLAGACGAVSVFVGCATGASTVLTVVLVALWGFAGGLLAALGPEALQIGLTSVVLLLVFGGQPAPPEIAAARAALILVGGVLQAALAVAAWPVRRFGPQRAALAALFRQLAAYARAPSDPGEAPPEPLRPRPQAPRWPAWIAATAAHRRGYAPSWTRQSASASSCSRWRTCATCCAPRETMRQRCGGLMSSWMRPARCWPRSPRDARRSARPYHYGGSRLRRDPSYRLTDLPDLRTAERALTDALGSAPVQDGRRPSVRYRDAVLVSEVDRVTDSVDTMAGLLPRSAGTTRADRGRVARWCVGAP